MKSKIKKALESLRAFMTVSGIDGLLLNGERELLREVESMLAELNNTADSTLKLSPNEAKPEYVVVVYNDFTGGIRGLVGPFPTDPVAAAWAVKHSDWDLTFEVKKLKKPIRNIRSLVDGDPVFLE